MNGGAFWLSLAYGTWRRTGRSPEPPRAETPGEVCINCGPGVGAVVLVPRLVLAMPFEAGKSVLIGGVAWASEDTGSLQAPPGEWVVVGAAIDEAPK